MPSFAQGRSSLLALIALSTLGLAASSQQPATRAEKSRVAGPIDDAQLVTLAGNVHPLARGEFDLGAVASETPLPRMVLHLKPSPSQQAELDALVEAQHDSQSALFHHWLTPEQFGSRFGANSADLGQITSWLQSHGFAIEEVSASRQLLIFSGNAGQVADAFHTDIHRYRVNGVEHIANAQDPQIPAALSGLVGGIVSLHDFRRASQVTSKRPLGNDKNQTADVQRNGETHVATPQYTSGGSHYLYPADWATIYDLNPLYAAGKTGTGASIAIVGRSNINMADVTKFRSGSGLIANDPTVIFVSSNPGLISGDQDESTLDVEWSGAVAPAASVKFVVGASTATTDGVDLSAQYIVNHATAQVMSTSYGSCEQDMGATELAFYNSLWEQAASEGISAFVSSGDSGAAGCDGGSSSRGTVAGVNGLCTSPYSTCVGGTEFNEGSAGASYWSTTNSASSESALGYIPEKVWNESGLDGGSGLWASTGGASIVYQQPTWQRGVPGVTGSMRDVPDVAMTAASHDGYIINEDGQYYVIAGTSAASPSFAGVMALVVQSEGGKGQGNANPALYAMLNAAKDPFHATPSGNNSVPGVSGFTASGASYNLATGLGSVDGAVLVGNWGSGSGTVAAPVSGVNFSLASSATSGSALVGKSVSFVVSAIESGSAKNAVTLTAKVPTGVAATFSRTSIQPGTTATVTLTAASASAAGLQTITVTGSDSTGTQSVAFAFTVTPPPSLSLTAAPASVVLAQSAKSTVALTAATGGSFTGNISWTVSGLPAGVSAAWSSNPIASISGATTNAETLTLTASSTATIASPSITVSAVGDGLVSSKAIKLQVTPAPGVSLAVAPAAISMQSLGTSAVTVSATPVGGLQIAAGGAGSTISVASGLPNGISGSFGAAKVASTGVISWTLTLTGSANTVATNASLHLTATVLGVTGATYTGVQTAPLTVTLTPPTLAVAAALNSISVAQGSTDTDVVSLAVNGSFTGPINLSVTGLPSGVTAAWSNAAVNPSASTGSSTLTLTAATSAAATTASITITAKGDGLVVTRRATVQVIAAQSASVAHPAAIARSAVVLTRSVRR